MHWLDIDRPLVIFLTVIDTMRTEQTMDSRNALLKETGPAALTLRPGRE